MLLGLVYQLEWIADRPSLLMQNLLGASFADKYTDAYAVAEMAPTLRDYLLAVGSRSVASLASPLNSKSRVFGSPLSSRKTIFFAAILNPE